MNLLSNLNVTLFKYEIVINLIAHLLFHSTIKLITQPQLKHTRRRRNRNWTATQANAARLFLFLSSSPRAERSRHSLTHLEDFVHDEYIANESFDSKYFCSQSTRGPLDRMLSSCRLPHFEELFLLILINKLSRY